MKSTRSRFYSLKKHWLLLGAEMFSLKIMQTSKLNQPTWNVHLSSCAPGLSRAHYRSVLHKQGQWARRCEAAYEMIAGQKETLPLSRRGLLCNKKKLPRWCSGVGALSASIWMRQNHSFITTRSWVNHVSVGMAAALFRCLPLKSPAIMGRAHRVPAATLTSVSLGGFPLDGRRPSRQPHWGLAPVVPVSRVSGSGLPHWCGGAVMRL